MYDDDDDYDAERYDGPIIAVIFGAQGQLGFELAELLEAKGAGVVRVSREDVDVTDLQAIWDVFDEVSPTHVFNCTAYNAVDQAEEERDNALLLNGVVPGVMASAAAEEDAVFVHFSTDYVFGEGHTRPIDESHAPSPLSAYGRSKWLGEQRALQHNANSYIIRCCGLYGERRANFVRTMVRMALLERPLKVVSDQMISPTWVRPLARQVHAILHAEPPYGVYHAVAHGVTSWFDYAGAIFEILDLKPSLSPVLQADWSAAARRPSYSVLDNALLRLGELDEMPDWRTSLEAMLREYGAQIMGEEQAKLG